MCVFHMIILSGTGAGSFKTAYRLYCNMKKRERHRLHDAFLCYLSDGLFEVIINYISI